MTNLLRLSYIKYVSFLQHLVHLLVSYCSFFYNFLNCCQSYSGCDLCSPLFYTVNYCQEFFFHIFTYYFERQWVPYHQLTMYTLNDNVQQTFVTEVWRHPFPLTQRIWYGWLQYSLWVLYRFRYSRVSLFQDFPDWHSKHTLLLKTQSITSPVSNDIKKNSSIERIKPISLLPCSI